MTVLQYRYIYNINLNKNNILIHIGIVQLILSWTKPNMIKWVGDTDQYVQHISVYYHLFLVILLDICYMFNTCFFHQKSTYNNILYWISKQKTPIHKAFFSETCHQCIPIWSIGLVYFTPTWMADCDGINSSVNIPFVPWILFRGQFGRVPTTR